MDYRIDKILDLVSKNGNIYEYEKINRMPLAVSGNIQYSRGATIGYSVDYGKTFTELACPVFKSMHISSNMIVYGFIKNGLTTDLYRSSNFTTFTKVDLSSFGNIIDVQPYGFDSNGNVFTFVESFPSPTPNPVCRVFRTTDAGLNFTIALSIDAGYAVVGKIGHAHNVTYLGGESQYDEPNVWILTTGDHKVNVKWFTSEDNGVNWSEVVGVSGQKYRTTGMNRLGNKLLWSSDAVPGTISGIYTSDYDNIIATTELVHPLPLTSWGCVVRAKGVCITVREGNWQKDGCIYIFATDDAGKTWKIEKELPIKNIPVGVDQPGFHYIIGPDGEGSYFIQAVALRDVGALKIKNKDIYKLI